MHLSDKALLCNLSVRQWVARKLDKDASAQVARANNAVGESGRYNKSLLPSCNLLDKVKAKSAFIRAKFYKNTLPWGIEGTYILPSANYLAFMMDFRDEKNQWETLVKQFLDDYEDAQREAQHLLGNLYNADDYPPLAMLARKFSMDMAIMPVPTAGDFRVELLDEEYKAIQEDVERRVAESSTAAMRDVWQRLYDRVEWLNNKLSDPEAVFRDTGYETCQEMCGLLTRLNFAEDPDLENMRRDAEAKLFRHHPESLRNDPDLRRDVAAESKAMMDKMSIFMEGL